MFRLMSIECSIDSSCILLSCWCFHCTSIIALTALRDVLMKAVLLVGSGIYRCHTSVLQRVRFALKSMIFTNYNRMRPCHGKVETGTIYGEGL